MIKRVTDVKLNVKPIYIGFEHKYYYEGPCRMAGGEAIEPGYDGMMNGIVFKGFVDGLNENFGKIPFLNIMEPSSTTCTDDWDINDAHFEALLADERDVDVYVAVGGFGTGQVFEEFCVRAKHPIIPAPANMFGPLCSVGPRYFGADIVPCYDWGEVVQAFRVLRAQKVLAKANILLAPRFSDTKAKAGGTDTFRDLTAVTDKLGTHFRTISMHELLDQMTPAPEGGNHTTPGRETPNITQKDIAEKFEGVFWNAELEIPQGCTGCAHLLDDGWTVPRCVDACAVGGLRFGDESDLADEIAQAEKLDPKSNVYYLNLPKRWVAGQVIDPMDDEVIIGATVTMQEEGNEAGEVFKATTDEFGDFWFRQVEGKSYHLWVEAEGFMTRELAGIDATAADANVGSIGMYKMIPLG